MEQQERKGYHSDVGDDEGEPVAPLLALHVTAANEGDQAQVEHLSIIDTVLKANQLYAQNFDGGRLPARPALKLAVVTCKDARIMVEPMLGLKPGDAHIIRNAGGIVLPDVIRSLLVSHYMLGTQEIMIINHTGCGMMGFTDTELFMKIRRATGTAAAEPEAIHTFTDLDENVRKQVEKVRSHPWIPEHIVVRGFVYDIETGWLREVE
jgi:carbonic anhydrase